MALRSRCLRLEPNGDNYLINSCKMAVAREFVSRFAVTLWRQTLRVSKVGTIVCPSSVVMTRNSSSYSEFQLSKLINLLLVSASRSVVG